MTCAVQDEQIYEGEVIEMAKHKDKKIEEQLNELCKETESIRCLVWKALGILISASLTVIGWMGVQLYDLKGISEKNSAAITDIQKNLDEINAGLNGEGETKGVYTRLALIEETLNIPTISASADITASVSKASIERNNIEISTTPLDSDMTVGTDSEGNVYIAKDLIGETILLTYTEDDKKVYFLGQYNDNYKWDGFCVTNAYYSNGSLYGICESDFKDGKRLNYKSFVSQDEPNVWIFSNKTCDGEKNTGTNVHYSAYYDKTKNFTDTNVRVSDILYVDKFLDSINATITKYYSGNTCDSLFNDDSGNAYEAIYNEDGTIRTLYVGQFVDGYFNDSTGNAWDISYSDEQKTYFYNKGTFKNGTFTDGSSTPVDTDKINSIVSKYKFDCELSWR